MEATTQDGTSYIADATTYPNPLAAALHAVAARLRRKAEALGLGAPDVHVSTTVTCRGDEAPRLSFSLLLTGRGEGWHLAQAQGHGPSLEQAEADVLRMLQDERTDAVWHTHEQNPCCQGDAMALLFRELAASEYDEVERAIDSAISHQQEALPDWA